MVAIVTFLTMLEDLGLTYNNNDGQSYILLSKTAWIYTSKEHCGM